MREERLHFPARTYSERIVRNLGFEPEQERALVAAVAGLSPASVLVYGPGKCGRYARPHLGESFLAYVDGSTPDLLAFGPVRAVFVGVGPPHYRAVVEHLRARLPADDLLVFLPFEDLPPEPVRTSAPTGLADTGRFAVFAACALGLSGALLGACLALGWHEAARWAWMLLGAVAALLGLEVLTRLAVALLPPERRQVYARLAAWTFPGHMSVVGHPFTQHTGNPARALIGNAALGWLSPFNNWGFLGEDLFVPKPPDTLRLAFLGGSTTMDGYPGFVERLLNSELGTRRRFEAMNFGMGGYCSAHGLVNYLLNVLDLAPDYVVIHEGWNDCVCRNHPPETFRADYSHALKSFLPPVPRDRNLLRLSMLYRVLTAWADPEPAWTRLGPATLRPAASQPETLNADLSELRPFERNIRMVLDLSRLRGVRPVLTTQPRLSRPRSESDAIFAGHMDQCNEVVRRIAADYGPHIGFVDLDRLMTGHMDHVFTDIGHMNEEGCRFKAQWVAQAISQDLAAREAAAGGERGTT